MDFLRKFGEELPIFVSVMEEEMKGRAGRIQELEESNEGLKEELALAETRIEELEARNEYEAET